MFSRNWARRNRLTALGMVLCLLAVIFAVEAKLAWYSQDATARVELSALKLRADEAPKQIADMQGASSALPDLLPQIELILAFSLVAVVGAFRPDNADSHLRITASPGAYPPLFLRPPPHS